MGMKTYDITNDDVSASSEKPGHEASTGRLGLGFWSPLDGDESPYFQVVFSSLTTLTSISVQGGMDGGFVKEFQLQASLDEEQELAYIKEVDSEAIKVRL